MNASDPDQRDIPTAASEPRPDAEEVASTSSKANSNFEETTTFSSNKQTGLAEAMAAAKHPAAFGRYTVTTVHGSGGFGTVYRGHDSQLDRPVAIKVQHRAGVSTNGVEEFLREARRIARLRHSAIVTVHDVGAQDGQCYIVSDFLDGVSLKTWLETHRPTWQETVRIVAVLADALGHAHAQSTIHRDIKPANVILTAGLQPVLVDFGLGIDESQVASGSERGLIAGSPAYMSPEMTSGEGHRIDGRTDIYSLGVVMYEMLCGRRPFRADTIIELLRQVRQDEPQPPRQLVPDIPRDVEKICLTAMAKPIHLRFTTAGDMADELRRVLGAISGASHAAVAGHAAAETKAPGTGSGRTSASGKAAATLSGSHGSVATTSSERRREAERRQLTVLCCNLADAAALSEQLDPEDLHEVLREHQIACSDVARRFDGHVVQSVGDGLLVCFGYPIAHEDAAQQAVRAGLALLAELGQRNKRLLRDKKVQLAARIGIHTGLVVTGESAQKSASESLSIVGEARNVAAGLEASADPDSVVISSATHRLVHGFFDCESLGSRTLKGVSRPTEVHRVRGERKTTSRIDVAGVAGLTPLVGRDREVGLLLDRWEQVKEGRGQVAMLIGEPGIGKSRMLHEVKSHVAGEHSPKSQRAAIECRCSPHHQNSGLNPVTDFLERHLEFVREESAEAKVGRLERMLGSLKFPLADAVPLFASLLSLPLDVRYPPLTLTPERLKQKTLEVLTDWLRRLAEEQPVLFIVEDLHWMDASTRELLDQLVEQAAGDRLLMLLTFRPEFKPPWSGTHVTQVSLPRLTKRQVAEMVSAKAKSGSLPAEVADQVAARTDGVPLFVEECTKMLVESGLLREENGQFVLTGPLPRDAIPSTLQDLLMARLDRLADAREVAQLGATIGREFSHELLQAIATFDAAALDIELAKLVEAELVFKKGRPPHTSYLFKHALIQDAAYQSLLKSKRQHCHQRIAEVLEQQFPETAATQPELLAHHFTEAGLKERAIAYWEKAGLACRERSANAEAIAHLTKGLQLLEALDDTPARDAQELRLQVPLGTALLSTKGYAAPEVGPVFTRARELCEKIGQAPQLFAVMWGIWAWHVVRGNFRLCMELAAEAMQLAGKLNDPGITMEALFMPGLTMLYRADFAGARDHCAKAITEYDDRELCRIWAGHTGQNSGVTHRCYLALALWHLGYPDQALATNRETMARAREANHPFSLAYALHHTGWLMHHMRLGREAAAAGDEEIGVAIEQGFAMWHATGQLYRAAGLSVQGRVADALPQLRTGPRGYQSLGAELALPFYLSVLADSCLKAGQFEEGLRAVDDAVAFAHKNEDLFQEAELYRLRGELLLAASPDNQAQAESCFQQAIATARRQGSKSWELRATMSLARLWHSQGKTADARRELSAVFGSFTEGFTTPDLVDAAELLATL